MKRSEHEAAQDDPWELTLRTVVTFDGMDAAINRLCAELYTRDQDLRGQLPKHWSDVHQNMWGHKFEGYDVIPHDNLREALTELVRGGHEDVGLVRKALCRADQVLGRPVFLMAIRGRPPTEE